MRHMQLLDGLNKAQLDAVTHVNGPALVLAGAGTGKTTVITRRIAWLIEQGHAKPNEILALTFTDKAAAEMEERVDILVPMGFVNTQIMTFHALGDQILRDHGLEIGLSPDFRVMSHFSQVVFLRQLLRRQKLEYFAPLGSPFRFVDALLGHFSRLKDESISAQQYQQYVRLKQKDTNIDQSERIRLNELSMLYRLYVEECRSSGQLDFGDQIVLSTELLQHRPSIAEQYQSNFKFILVDEYQDTNTAQANMLKSLINKQRNIMVVGDDDQSIYRFRGAAISNILDFKKDYSGAVQIVLTDNYRSSQQILDSAYRLIQHNNPDRLEVQNKVSKQLKATRVGDRPSYYHFDTIQKEHDWVALQIKELIGTGVAPRDIAILVRKNSQIKNVVQTLTRHQIKANSSAPENLLQKTEIKGLVSLIDFLIDPENSGALYRCLIGEYHRMDIHSVQPLMAQARRSHLSLSQVISEQQPEVVYQTLVTLTLLREQIKELSVGQLLYQYLKESGVLDRLIERADSDNESAIKVQNIAKFFRFIKDFEAVSDDPSAIGFGQYMSEIFDSSSDLNAVESPLDDESIRVMTVHRAKGLEFEAVFIVEVADQVFPSRRQADQLPLPADLVPVKSSSDWHIQEERRLFYVALTRAKSQLYITSSADYGKTRPRKPSPFIAETLGEIITPAPTTSALGLEHIEDFAKKPDQYVNLAAQLFHDGWLHLSAQQVDDYLRDPGQFWVLHLLNIPKGPFHAMVYGSAIHNAIELYNRAKLQRKPITCDELLEEFEQTWRSEGFASKEHELERKARGRVVLKKFFEQHEADHDWPTYVEEPFTLSLENIKVRINGRFDAVYDRDGQIEIRDYKTSELSGEAAAKRRLSGNIQLGIYALAWQRLHEQSVQQLSLDFVDSDILVSTNRINTEKILEKIASVADGIRNNRFHSGQMNIQSLEELI